MQHGLYSRRAEDTTLGHAETWLRSTACISHACRRFLVLTCLTYLDNVQSNFVSVAMVTALVKFGFSSCAFFGCRRSNCYSLRAGLKLCSQVRRCYERSCCSRSRGFNSRRTPCRQTAERISHKRQRCVRLQLSQGCQSAGTNEDC